MQNIAKRLNLREFERSANKIAANQYFRKDHCRGIASQQTKQIPPNVKRASRSPLFPYSKSPVDLEVEVNAETHCGHFVFVLNIADQRNVAAEIV